MCGLSFCFFFFKQKTAYEMRISDWSSDVCSSDLPGSADRARRPGGPPILQVYLTQARALGVSPNRHFDERYYRAIHRDVDRAVEAGGFWSGFHHYVRHGHAERRRARPAARRVALDLRAFEIGREHV